MKTILKKKCLKQGNKLISDKAQCCWCEYTQGDETHPQGCLGFKIDEIKETVADLRKVLLSYESKEKITINCRCSSKRNKMINFRFDTFSDDVFIN